MSFQGPRPSDPRRTARPRCPSCSSTRLQERYSVGWKRMRLKCEHCRLVFFATEARYEEPLPEKRKAAGSGVIAGRREVFPFRPLATYPWDAHRALCESGRKR